MKTIQKYICAIILFVATSSLFSQTYNLVWQDNFDGATLDSSIWNIEQRIGVWNTGQNNELEHYRKENITVGNDGSGNNCLILTAKQEELNGYPFTSGRINTKGKFSFRYGKLEARIKMPDLADGLWPAFWLLGYTEKGWPDCGETDVLEMGHAAGISAGTQNKYIGGALHWENAGSYAGYGTNYTSGVNLNEDYHIYTLVWTNTQVQVFLDNNITPYFAMNVAGTDAEEFRDYPQYILFNLAVGGSLTGITTETGITAPMPANMYIDYIRLYQEDGVGDLIDSANSVFGTFGVYEETAPVSMNTDYGFDAYIDTLGLTENSTITAKEGSLSLAYNTVAEKDYRVTLSSYVVRDMSKYSAGSIQFWYKSESADSMQVGISDSDGHTSFTTLKDGLENNPARDGEWQFAWVNISSLPSGINLAKMKDLFILKGKTEAGGYFGVDRVIWSETEYHSLTDNYYGIYAEHDSIQAKLDFGNGGHIYVWNGFVGAASGIFYGADVISYTNTADWNAFGIHSDNALDLRKFYDGSLQFSYKTASTTNIEVGFKNSQDISFTYTFTGATGLIRDNKWHTCKVNFQDFIKTGGASISTADLNDIVIPFYLLGNVKIALDEIYLSANGQTLEYPDVIDNLNDRITAGNVPLLYPNPASDQLNIMRLKQTSTIRIFDITGRLVFESGVEPESSLDISSVTTGLYSYRIESGDFVHSGYLIKR